MGMFDDLIPATPSGGMFDDLIPQKQAAPVKSAMEHALEPITSYPAVQGQMAREAYDTMASGASKAVAPNSSMLERAAGAGQAALGGVSYVASPVNAALKTLIGRPVENITGAPQDYTEFAAGLAIPGIGMTRMPGAVAKAATKAPTVEQLKASYVAAKESPEVAAVQIKPEAIGKQAETIVAELNKEWLDPVLAPKTHRILEMLTQAPEGSTVTMANVDSARRRLGAMVSGGGEEAAAASIVKKRLDEWFPKLGNTPDVREGFVRFYHGGDDPTSGGGRWVTPDAEYARRFRTEGKDKSVHFVDVPKGHPVEVAARQWDEFDELGRTNMVGRYRSTEIPEDWAVKLRPLKADVVSGDPTKAHEILTAGRKDYTAAKVGEAFDKRINKAEARANTTYSGLNLQNQLRQKAEQFLDSADSRALSATERKMVEALRDGNFSQNTLRYVGKLLGGGGGLGAFTTGGLGGLATGGPGVLLPVVGYATTKLASHLTMKQAERVSEALRSRSPLGKQLNASLASWGKYARIAEQRPMTPRIAAMLAIQSRNLSNNLKDAGIEIAPVDLVRGVLPSLEGEDGR